MYYYKKYNCQNELMIESIQLNKMNINHLFLDYNSLIHPCAQQILSANNDNYINLDDDKKTDIIESDIVDNCLLYTRYLINQVFNQSDKNKDRTVYITIDGVAPRSKMNQQRERRYKSEFFKTGDINTEKSCLWDSNKITPGTCFMIKLRNRLIKFAEILREQFFINCIISDSSENGEGEHKIMTIINDLKSDDRICIYGLDADLIMLSLMNKRCDEIVLIRDNSFNNKLSDDKKVIDYLNIKNLRKHIYKDIINTLSEYSKEKFDKMCIKSLIYDYIIICFLLGNDFLDHLPSLSIKKNGIDTIMKAYSYSWKGKYLINKDMINTNNWKNSLNLVFLKDIMYQLKNHEVYFFKNFKIENLALSENKLLSDLEENNNVFFYKDNIIFDNCTDLNYKKRYYTFYGINDIDDACLNYIEGLYWIFGYYNTHIHKNWTWYYRYHNTPFCSDLFDYLRNNTDSIQQFINNTSNLNKSCAFSSLKQLYMVLPKSSLENILTELNIQNNSCYLLKFREYYPDKLYVDIINKRYLWQTKIFFDNMDDSIIDMFI